MAAGQVSVWIPITVAVLGIVGVVFGQLINSWRENRRWQRELQREDLRWHRERISSLQEEKIDAYADFLEVMWIWHSAVSATLKNWPQVKLSSEQRLKMSELDKKAQGTIGRILLLGPKSVREDCAILVIRFQRCMEILAGNEDGTRRNAERAMEAYFDVLNELRDDIVNLRTDFQPK